MTKSVEKEYRFSISELASEFEITTRSIRFYEEKGLLISERRSGLRVFAASERVKLKLILRGKRLGFSLDQSQGIINMYNPGTENSKQLETLLDKITEKREQLERKRKEIGSMLKDLKTAESNCQEALAQLSA